MNVTFCENRFLGDRTTHDEYLNIDDEDDEDDGEPTQDHRQLLEPTTTPAAAPRTGGDRTQVGRTTSKLDLKSPSTSSNPTRQSLRLLERFKRNDQPNVTLGEQESAPNNRMALRSRDRLQPPSQYTSGIGDRRQIGNDQNLDNLQHEITESTDASTVNTATECDHDSTMLAINGLEFACSAVSPLDDVSQSHREAMASKDHVEWAKAEQLELHQLREAKTWKLVELPTGCKAIGSRWTYAKQINTEGEIVRYKARLVCKGFSQVQGIDYFETYSPVVKMTTARTCMALVVN
ncbi:hypothetical protein Ae201684P_001042 [Aphanomyces euteiches]|uniref:Reverse transcriptase Ty1/copia-type domain-containing protein n=1 Tax=Aphanomyces euteiches TaxID=100861 RepID=A0A6G0WGH5_9STRA|nr:hypothetical protein Ae201684_015479 [Aphanomyces euteiches]KAH9097564.1 hypothetical protein Ae201684P_001042 [Aphanomyces euteiches]